MCEAFAETKSSWKFNTIQYKFRTPVSVWTKHKSWPANVHSLQSVRSNTTATTRFHQLKRTCKIAEKLNYRRWTSFRERRSVVFRHFYVGYLVVPQANEWFQFISYRSCVEYFGVGCGLHRKVNTKRLWMSCVVSECVCVRFIWFDFVVFHHFAAHQPIRHT